MRCVAFFMSRSTICKVTTFFLIDKLFFVFWGQFVFSVVKVIVLQCFISEYFFVLSLFFGEGLSFQLIKE